MKNMFKVGLFSLFCFFFNLGAIRIIHPCVEKAIQAKMLVIRNQCGGKIDLSDLLCIKKPEEYYHTTEVIDRCDVTHRPEHDVLCLIIPEGKQADYVVLKEQAIKVFDRCQQSIGISAVESEKLAQWIFDILEDEVGIVKDAKEGRFSAIENMYIVNGVVYELLRSIQWYTKIKFTPGIPPEDMFQYAVYGNYCREGDKEEWRWGIYNLYRVLFKFTDGVQYYEKAFSCMSWYRRFHITFNGVCAGTAHLLWG